MRGKLAVPLLVAAALAAGCGAPRGPVAVADDFEKGVRGWERAADVPGEGSWGIEPTREAARSGSHSVNLTLEAGANATAWLERPLEVQAGQAYSVDASVHARAAAGTADVVMALGPQPPVEAEGFPAPGTNTTGDPGASRGGLRAPADGGPDWERFGFEWTVPGDNNGTLWAAVGIALPDPGSARVLVDDVELELTPEGSGGADGQGPY